MTIEREKDRQRQHFSAHSIIRAAMLAEKSRGSIALLNCG
jgi:hypothetical protein